MKNHEGVWNQQKFHKRWNQQMERKARNKYIEYAGDRCICVQPAAVETFVFHRE